MDGYSTYIPAPIRSLQKTNGELGEEVAVLKKKMEEFEAKVSWFTSQRGT